MIKPLFYDNHILVVNKPAGLATEGEEGETLEEVVRLWVKQQYNKSGAVFLQAAHRLDKCVSGLVVFGKTSKALSRLHEAFRSHLVEKKYYAIVEGTLQKEEGELRDYLRHDPFRAVITTKEDPRGKEARLFYKRKWMGNSASILEIALCTGRYHQIRAQFSHLGHPIVNDVKYGGRQISKEGFIALHHGRILFRHPVTKEKMELFALPPQDWQEMFCNLHGIQRGTFAQLISDNP